MSKYLKKGPTYRGIEGWIFLHQLYSSKIMLTSDNDIS